MMDGILAVTYRCNSRCVMCNTWRSPSEKTREIGPADLETLPSMARLNITGGEPFLREDLGAILGAVKKKAKRVVISTNGFLTETILKVMKEHRDVGVRISFDGLGATHERIRGVETAHRLSMETLRGLKGLGVKDLGMAVTVSDLNARDLVPLFNAACEQGVELATAILHNAYYFHKEDNEIANKQLVEAEVMGLIREYLRSSHPKNWFRAYFTKGLLDQMYGRPRELRCTMATDSFFMDPYGNIRPCNVMDLPFGNIREAPFGKIWKSPEAANARRCVASCAANCWMIGSVGHLMRHKMWVPLFWIARNKWGRSKGTARVQA